MKFLILLLLVQSAWADEWFCTSQSSKKEGNGYLVCGVGRGSDVASAREDSLDQAKKEFQGLCAQSADCRWHDAVVEPLRTACSEKEGQFVCYRAVKYTLSSVPPPKPAADRPLYPESIDEEMSQRAEAANPILPKDTSYRVFKAKTAEEVHDLLCKGPRPQVSYSFVFHPQGHPGLPIDQAEQLRAQDIARAKVHFKSLLFYVGAVGATDPKIPKNRWYEDSYVPQSTALSDLIENYTYMWEKSEIKRLKTDRGVMTELGHLESEEDTSTPTTALRNRTSLWIQVLAASTSLTSQPLGSGDIKFKADLDLALACTAIPISQLISK
jgi:hypothetical protein